jgi:dTDP-glucose 4,6-dehydratase
MRTLSNKNILITGAAGFIGSNFVRLLLSEYPDSRITVVDKLTYAGNTDNLTEVMDRIDFVQADISDSKEMQKLFGTKSFNVVVNFAAESHVDRSLIDSSPFLKSNILGTAVLLECVRQFPVDVYLQISTDEVYGSIENGSFTETNTLCPSSPYSASKASADCLVNAYHVSYDVPVLITRSANNYGPRQYPEKLIPYFVSLAMKGEQLPVYGDGRNIRDWLYVDDNCRAILTVLTKGEIGEVYNIGANVEKDNLEITSLIINLVGNPKSGFRFVKDRLGHDRRYSLNCDKIFQLGWKPASDFADTFRYTIEWYMKRWSNPNV